ncbi:MAG TPA: hypothetical protein VKV17_22935 [Bryobacteraceae bacterium]|nr:hypothetical protein [Bryobacteraceae bacterium]
MPLLLVGAACSRGNQSKEAIRQGVLDHLKNSSVNLAAMDMDVSDVQFSGNNADATVTFKPKGMTVAQGMALHYRMQQKGGRWAVVSIQDSGHAGNVPEGVANPHGAGGLPSGDPHEGAVAVMPSPDDLPPTTK